ncbi:MAG: precorrin-6A reductase [Oscillospiraceae bacterium]|nr:precorrin-6A reductase [Oscillospiraceae bacterium]
MHKYLIFAGTTEGRKLAEFCSAHQISADVSSATEYGAQLLPKNIGILTGRLDTDGICSLIQKKQYTCVIDATHPFATEVTENIRNACRLQEVPYWRLLRKMLPVQGEAVYSMAQITELLNQNRDIVLSTLGSKSAEMLTSVKHFPERIRLRVLPSQETAELLYRLGFRDFIQAKGPFSVQDNLRDIQQTGAKILLTKESGEIGGYPEKAEAAKQANIRLITLCRAKENGFSFAEITEKILRAQENPI